MEQVYKSVVRWPAQVCLDILNNNADYIFNTAQDDRARIYKRPNNQELLILLCKIILRSFLIIFSKKKAAWNIGIIDKPIHSMLAKDPNLEVKWLLKPTKKRWYADPFGFVHDAKMIVLFEDYNTRTKKAKISNISIGKDARPNEPSELLTELHHLSYPFILKEDSHYYCIPESRDASAINLYEILTNPLKIRKITTINNSFAARDATIIKYNGLYWLFFSLTDDDLHILYSKNLLGPWTPHANNPVKQDVQSSRSAGTPFIYNGEIYRPAQDCSKRYGYRIVINKIVCLSTSSFKEIRVKTIHCNKGKYRDGVHTIASIGNYTLIDGQKEYDRRFIRPSR